MEIKHRPSLSQSASRSRWRFLGDQRHPKRVGYIRYVSYEEGALIVILDRFLKNEKNTSFSVPLDEQHPVVSLRYNETILQLVPRNTIRYRFRSALLITHCLVGKLAVDS